MGVSTGNSNLGVSGLTTQAMALNVGTSNLGAGGLRTSGFASQTVTQALVASFRGTGLLDALLVFDPAHYMIPGSSPGALVDALGGPISYAAPNTQATPSVVAHSSGYFYAAADGVDDMLAASANQTVAYYCAVFRSPPNQTTWSDYGPPLDSSTTDGNQRFGALLRGSTTFDNNSSYTPRAVSRNGVVLSPYYDLSPITSFQIVSVSVCKPGVSQVVQMFSLGNTYFTRFHLAALGIRYTDPTADQQAQIESRMAPVRDALLASAS